MTAKKKTLYQVTLDENLSKGSSELVEKMGLDNIPSLIRLLLRKAITKEIHVNLSNIEFPPMPKEKINHYKKLAKDAENLDKEKKLTTLKTKQQLQDFFLNENN